MWITTPLTFLPNQDTIQRLQQATKKHRTLCIQHFFVTTTGIMTYAVLQQTSSFGETWILRSSSQGFPVSP